MPAEKEKKSIFVTVGTTRFDELVSGVMSDVALGWMRSQGYTDLIIQYGAGDEPPTTSTTTSGSPPTVAISAYRFRPTLAEDMERADLIISHAGAGTVMEVLEILAKPLVVVINTRLMDNHQTELAEAMARRGHLHMVESPQELNKKETWEHFGKFMPVPHKRGDEFEFVDLLDAHLGFVTAKSKAS